MPHLRNEFRPLNRFDRCQIGTIDPPECQVADMEAAHERRIQRLEQQYEQTLPTRDMGNYRPLVVNGIPYESVRLAAAATGIPERTIRDVCGGCQCMYYNRKAGKRESFTAAWVEERNGLPRTTQSERTR